MKSACQVKFSQKNWLPSRKTCELCLIHCFSEGFVVIPVLQMLPSRLGFRQGIADTIFKNTAAPC